jgi:hypothetical protein
VSELFTNISALTVFLIIAGVGLTFLVVSLLFGELFDHAGIDVGLDGGGHGPGFLDTRAISVFITSFGGFGAIGIQMGLGVLASSLLGLGSGVVLGGIVSLFARFLYGQQASSSVSASQLVGRTAQITVSIPAGGIGQISCRIGEERVEKIARTRDGIELKAGTLVRIEEIAGDSVIVSSSSEGQSFQPRLQA